MQAPQATDHAAHRSGSAVNRSAHDQGHPVHAHASHEAPRSAPDLTAPCPCGCEEHSGSATARSRLGAALPHAAPARIDFVPPPPAGFVLARAPVAPILTDDPVPIPS